MFGADICTLYLWCHMSKLTMSGLIWRANSSFPFSPYSLLVVFKFSEVQFVIHIRSSHCVPLFSVVSLPTLLWCLILVLGCVSLVSGMCVLHMMVDEYAAKWSF